VSLTAVSSFEMIPEIVTDRLRLRPHGMQDFAASAAMWADPEVTRFIGGRPFSEEETWARLLRYAGHWSFLGFGYWAVEEHSGSDFIGEVGFADFKRQIQPPIGDIPELGWVFVPRVHGRGYATEAVRAALEWGKTNLSSRWTASLIHPDNLASIRVADKCGFSRYCQTTYRNEATVIFTRQNC
jgi:RimJ/RimL family protein N-acetyltransferase